MTLERYLQAFLLVGLEVSRGPGLATQTPTLSARCLEETQISRQINAHHTLCPNIKRQHVPFRPNESTDPLQGAYNLGVTRGEAGPQWRAKHGEAWEGGGERGTVQAAPCALGLSPRVLRAPVPLESPREQT